MADGTPIEWTDATWNPIRARNTKTGKVGWFCTHASEGCRFCYAEGINRRLGTGVDYLPQALKAGDVEVFLDEHALVAPLSWKKPRKVFPCSMTDIGAAFVTDAMLDRMFAVMLIARQHSYQVLTKRPERLAAYLGPPGEAASERHARLQSQIAAFGQPEVSNLWFQKHIWIGASAEDQSTYDKRTDALLSIIAFGAKFVSLEPLLDGIDMRFSWDHCDLCGGAGILARWPKGKCHVCEGRGKVLISGQSRREGYRCLQWVIVGGESGPKARPCWVPAVRNIVRQCTKAGVPVLVKQLGANVRDRNDAGFEGCDPSEWPEIDPDRIQHDLSGHRDDYQGAPVRIRLNDRKGGDMAEWPEDLRVRQFPQVRA